MRLDEKKFQTGEIPQKIQHILLNSIEYFSTYLHPLYPNTIIFEVVKLRKDLH